MKNIVKTVSLLTIISVIPAAFAATSRVGMINNKATSRLPSIAGYMVSGGTTTVRTTTSSTTSYLGDQECLDKYTDCIKGTDACGADLEECTTRVLFHAQMPKCLNVLYQCSAAGVNQLFGTSSISALSNVASYKTVGGAQEVDRYTYPTDGSALGQMIIGAAEANKLTKDQCVRRYTNCLKRDDICGGDFELCTTPTEFRKQAILCDSTLSRCDNAGKTELYGSVAAADTLTPAGNTRLSEMIADGASTAATNAVVTCEKVVDNCLYNACVKNPWRCVTGTNTNVIDTADFIVGGTTTLNTDANSNVAEVSTETQVRQMLKAQCLSKIGSNKYCHMTYLEKVPKDKDLVDVDLQEEVFALAYSARKSAVNTKIQEAVKEFDKEAKDKCIDTIKSCAMRSCGGGIGSVCYKQSKLGSSTTRSTVSSSAYGDVHVNGDNTRGDIKSGCAAIVNADANCQYAAASASTNDSYTYTYTKDSTFDTLFPAYSANNAAADPIGAVSTLNALLATSYNEAAIATMKKQCETVALSCVKSMCGTDYINCYRARTDVVSGSYDTGNGKFDRSMNKMGGVLDYNIVLGLCMNTVKNSSVCEEHLKVATADWRSNNADSESWGGASSVREGWLGANTTKENKSTYGAEGGILVACRASNETAVASSVTDSLFNTNLDCSGTMEPINGACVGVMDGGCIYDTPVYMGETEYVLENAGTTMFQQLLADVEKEVQAKYNAKLTKERNMCLNENHGGVMGSSDMGSTYQWVKLKGNKVPKSYQNNGLQTKDFVASNDLYGSFCRVKVTVTSDDKDIQEGLGDSATAYFAVGDTFTCGSWIKSTTLQKISETVGSRELCKQGYGKWENGKCNDKKTSTKEKVAYAWATVAPALVGGVAGFAGMDAIQKKNGSLGGLLGGGSIIKKQNSYGEKCNEEVTAAKTALNKSRSTTDQNSKYSYYNEAVMHAQAAQSYAENAINDDGATVKDVSGIDFETLNNNYTAAVAGTTQTTYEWSEQATETVNSIISQIEKKIKCCGANCKTILEQVKTTMTYVPNASTSRNVVGMLNSAKAECDSCNDNAKCTNVFIPDVISGLEKTTDRAGEVKEQGAFEAKNYTEFEANLQKVKLACDQAEDAEQDPKKRRNANLIAGGVTAAASAALGAGITASVIKTKKENIKNEAAQEWMETIGDHIQGYVGSEEIGTYGDPVAIEME